jgi:hypothetical protein
MCKSAKDHVFKPVTKPDWIPSNRKTAWVNNLACRHCGMKAESFFHIKRGKR